MHGLTCPGRSLSHIDAAKRLASETQIVGGQSHTAGYVYGDKVNRTALVWPDGWRVLYGYDPLNRLSSAGMDANGDGSAETPLALYRYDALSQLTGIRRGSASWSSGVTSTDVAWKPEGLIDTLTHGFSGEVAGFSYGYDKSAKLTSESKASAFSWTPPVARTIAYDLGASGSATEKLDQYAKVNGQAATYDANGNRTLLAGLTTTHDSENRLVAASKPTGMSVAYIYDAMNRRVMKDFTSGGADTVFVSAGDMEIAEYDGAGSLLRRYVPGLKVDDRIAMIEAGGAISYYHPDRLGNVLAVTNSSGQVTDRYKYTPFGIEEPISLSGNLYRYTGRRLDPETGLYHYRARYYDPSDPAGGRFLEVDPIGYKDQMNRYAYVGNDPVNATDPTGLQTFNDLYLGQHVAKMSEAGMSDGEIGVELFKGAALGAAVGVGVTTLTVAPEAALLLASRAPTATRLAVVVSNAVVENPVTTSAAATAALATEQKATKLFGPFHRLEGSTQSAEAAALQQASGKMMGRAPRNSAGGGDPAVKAFDGPLPDGKRGVEFMTNTAPTSYNKGMQIWKWIEGSPGVESETIKGESHAVIRCFVTKNTQC